MSISTLSYSHTHTQFSCGGHANTYHNHYDLSCDYDKTSAGHSPLIAIALDGRGVYGVFEGAGAAPTDLDACGGHVGDVPETIVGSDTYPAGI